jgi:hypothetical protein
LCQRKDDQIELRREICRIVFHHTFDSKAELRSEFYDDAVKLGFARFSSYTFRERIAQADEPLALLAGLSWMTKEESTMAQYVEQYMRTNRGVGFERVVAYHLTIAFGQYAKLTDIFEFESTEGHLPDWTKKRGRLVSVNGFEDGRKPDYVDVDLGSRRAVLPCLGFKSNGPKATIKWLKNPGHAAFCFPDKHLGPDICFFLRLEENIHQENPAETDHEHGAMEDDCKDDNIILIFMQVKWTESNSHGIPVKVDLRAAGRVVPTNFYHSENGVSSWSEVVHGDYLIQW